MALKEQQIQKDLTTEHKVWVIRPSQRRRRRSVRLGGSLGDVVFSLGDEALDHKVNTTRNSAMFSEPRVSSSAEPIYDPLELMKMPYEERKEILKSVSKYAEELYASDPRLTDLEAAGLEELYDEASER